MVPLPGLLLSTKIAPPCPRTMPRIADIPRARGPSPLVVKKGSKSCQRPAHHPILHLLSETSRKTGNLLATGTSRSAPLQALAVAVLRSVARGMIMPASLPMASEAG